MWVLSESFQAPKIPQKRSLFNGGVPGSVRFVCVGWIICTAALETFSARFDKIPVFSLTTAAVYRWFMWEWILLQWLQIVAALISWHHFDACKILKRVGDQLQCFQLKEISLTSPSNIYEDNISAQRHHSLRALGIIITLDACKILKRVVSCNRMRHHSLRAENTR